jgi:hypothetical protein
MIKESVKSVDEYNLVLESIQKNYYILESNNSNKNERQYYKYNNRILLSNSKEFLDAVKKDIGGEIILDTAIGPFLFFGDIYQD